MPTPVRIIFRGLLAFVPREGSPPGPGLPPPLVGVTVLVPFLDEPSLAVSNRGNVIAAHRGFIRFPIDSHVGGRTPHVVLGADKQHLDGIIFLRDEDLFMSTGHAPAPFMIIQGTSNPHASQPDATNDPDYLRQKSDFRWVSRPAFVSSDAEPIDSDCLGANDKRLIGSRLLIKEGALRVYRLAGGEGPNERKPELVDIYEFSRGPTDTGGSVAQALAEECALELDAAQDRLTIEAFNRRQPPEKLWELTLGPSGGGIQFFFQSSEVEDLFPALLRTDAPAPQDFEVFYELSRIRPELNTRVIPQNTSGSGGGPRICPCGCYSPVPL